MPNAAFVIKLYLNLDFLHNLLDTIDIYSEILYNLTSQVQYVFIARYTMPARQVSKVKIKTASKSVYLTNKGLKELQEELKELKE